VIGAVLAGGRGERLGGDKALALLSGRPLVEHVLHALRAVADEVVVVAKPHTALPDLGVEVWHDEEPEHHPRNGIVTALRRADGAPVVVCAVDLPYAGPALALVATVAGAPTAVARAGGRLQPLCARYGADALAPLDAAAPGEPLTRTVERLGPAIVEVPRTSLINVNTPDDLDDAARMGTPAACSDD